MTNKCETCNGTGKPKGRTLDKKSVCATCKGHGEIPTLAALRPFIGSQSTPKIVKYIL